MKNNSQHLVGYAVLVLIVVVVIFGIIALASPRYRKRTLMAAGWTVGGLAGIYAVARGIAEFFNVHYSDPASYRGDWGGPSLVGVFLVHSGPGFVVVVAAVVYVRRRLRARRAGASIQPVRSELTPSSGKR